MKRSIFFFHSSPNMKNSLSCSRKKQIINSEGTPNIFITLCLESSSNLNKYQTYICMNMKFCLMVPAIHANQQRR